MSDINDDEDFDLGVDPSLEELTAPSEQGRIAIIRSSDRMGFKRCRRRWGWQSHLRNNLTPIEAASPLWYGSGFHYAMEDFHGLREWPSAVAAFEAYVKATYNQAKQTGKRLPYDWAELVQLGRGMVDYYTNTWLIARDPLRTYVVDGVPQVEVSAHIKVPFKNKDYDEVYYAVTLDRVVIDDNGMLWIVDYKTAKRIQTQFFQTDPQISAYMWAASQLYPDRQMGGFIYQQHRKDVPVNPKLLATGRLSTDKRQNTTHRHYRRCLINQYRAVENAPIENVDFLNWLNEQEDDTRDRFVQRNRVYRNRHQVEAEGTKILMEMEEMLNLDLPLYPNPTRECGHMCSFNSACVSMDDGSDWVVELGLGFTQKSRDFDSWRKFLPKPPKTPKKESAFA